MADQSARIRDLEAIVADLARRVGRLIDRPALVQPSRWPRTARTKAADGATYPSMALTTVFPAVFLDGENDDNTLNWIGERQGDDERISIVNITGGPIPAGIELAVWFERNTWWAEHDAELWGKLDEALEPSDNASFSVWDIYGGEGEDEETDTGDDVVVWAPPVFRTGTIESGKWGSARWDRKTQRFIFRDAEC